MGKGVYRKFDALTSQTPALNADLCLQVTLPVDPGVVLLDIAFTGGDASHGTVLH